MMNLTAIHTPLKPVQFGEKPKKAEEPKEKPKLNSSEARKAQLFMEASMNLDKPLFHFQDLPFGFKDDAFPGYGKSVTMRQFLERVEEEKRPFHKRFVFGCWKGGARIGDLINCFKTQKGGSGYPFSVLPVLVAQGLLERNVGLDDIYYKLTPLAKEVLEKN